MQDLTDGHFATRRAAAEFGGPEAKAHYPPDLELEPADLEISLHLLLEERTLEVELLHTLCVRRQGARTAVFDGVGLEALTVEDADGHDIQSHYDGEQLRVTWAQPSDLGDLRRLRARYRVVEPVAGAYFSFPTPSQPDAPRFCATDHETERARHWLLCVDHPAARPRLRFHLRAPDSFTALANGHLEAEDAHGDGTRTTTWRLDHPCPSYLTCFAIGEFVRCDDGEHRVRGPDGTERVVPIAYFGPAGTDPELLRQSFGRTGAMLAWIEGLLGLGYPYPKYFQFALPGIGGAMENISLVSWDGVFLLDRERQPEWGWLVDLINVHEMAHTWFGDWVVCRDFADSWLKESFATFIEAVWTHSVLGRDEGDSIAWSQAAAYFAEARDGYRRPIVTRRFASSWQLFDRHLYPGGARRLATLEAELGKETFWRGVRLYLARFAGQGVETEDLRRVFEEVSGRSLTRFFDQWFKGPGHPELRVRFRRDAERGQGIFELEQKQATAKEPGTTFEFQLVLAWRIDGAMRERRVRVTRARQEVHVPMDGEPDLVRVDPRGETLVELEFDPGEERLLLQLRASEDARGRYEAAWLLAAAPSAKRARAVGAALAVEPFWAARVELAGALARMGLGSAIVELGAALQRERDPRALEPMLRNALLRRDPRLQSALEARLDEVGELALPPRARAVALEALGGQREDAPVDRLVDAARRRAASMEPQSGALRGLGLSRQRQALEPLLLALAPEFARSDARPAAAQALGELAPMLERSDRERIVDRLLAALGDSDRLVALAAARGLSRAGETRAVAALETFARGLCVQERVAVQNLARSLSKGASGAPEKELEKLRTDYGKLEERLRAIEARLAGDGTTP